MTIVKTPHCNESSDTPDPWFVGSGGCRDSNRVFGKQHRSVEFKKQILKPGGLLLTNDQLPEIPAGSMRQIGITDVRYDVQGLRARDAVGWYQRR